MQIFSTIQLGESHPVFCEDFLFFEEVVNGLWLASVMDGCTMGKNSHFASSLFAKILKKQVQELRYQEFTGDVVPLSNQSLETIGKHFIRQLAIDLRRIQNILFLDTLEILSTLLLVLVDTHSSSAWAVVLGDGYIGANDKVHEIDQNNRPDYPAYHLSKDFEEWYPNSAHTFFFTDVTKITIATDGIGSFEKMIPEKPNYTQDILAFLLLESLLGTGKKALEKKIHLLKDKYGMLPLDDLAIIQLEWEN